MPTGVYKRKAKTKELTGHQTVSYSFGDGILNRDYTKVGTYTQLRAVRKDPTVSLARALLISCIQAGSWNIEVDDDVSAEVQEFIEHVLPLREDFIYNTVAFGKVDFGWIGFEKIFKVEEDRIVIEALKPLLHDMTNILVTAHGRFNGYRQVSIGGSGLQPSLGSIGPAYPLDVPVEKCLHIAFGVEAGYLYGMPLLENIRRSMDMWDECNDGARRYDKKLAGTHWVIKFPPGTATVDGETVDNGVIAAKVLAAMESNGSVAIPTTTAQVLQELTNAGVADLYAWSVQLLDDKGSKQKNFNDRLKYLDSQKVRGLGFPERAILEGTFGTKAEAGTHQDLALNNFEAVDRDIARVFNDQLINQLVELNYGVELVGKVRLVAAPLVKRQLAFLQKIYEGLNDPDVDVEALRDSLNIPTAEGDSEGLKKEKTDPFGKDEDDEDDE